MTKEQHNQYNMLSLVEYHFDNNVSIWSSNILISDVKNTLSEILSKVFRAARLQSINSTGATEDKAIVRTRLEEIGSYVSSGLRAYASRNPDQEELGKKAKITEAGFTAFRENDLLVYAENLNTAATEIITALEPYGIFPATLNELRAARTDFIDIMNEPDEITSARKGATQAIPVLLEQAIALLEDQMDNMMVVFKKTEGTFFNVYHNDRKIHRTGKRKMSLLITTLNASTKMPLAKANIEVVGHGIKRLSTEKGINRVQNLKEGNYTMTVSRPDFVSQTIPFTVRNHKTTEVVVELEGDVSKNLKT